MPELHVGPGTLPPTARPVWGTPLVGVEPLTAVEGTEGFYIDIYIYVSRNKV